MCYIRADQSEEKEIQPRWYFTLGLMISLFFVWTEQTISLIEAVLNTYIYLVAQFSAVEMICDVTTAKLYRPLPWITTMSWRRKGNMHRRLLVFHKQSSPDMCLGGKLSRDNPMIIHAWRAFLLILIKSYVNERAFNGKIWMLKG